MGAIKFKLHWFDLLWIRRPFVELQSSLLRWDGMGWAALATRRIVEEFTTERANR